MGTSSILSVLSFIIIFGMINSIINRQNIRSTENTYGYVKYTAARDIARNSIQIALRKIDTTTAVTSGAFPVTGSLDRGTYRVDGTIVNDSTLRLTAKSTFFDSSYVIKTTLQHTLQLFPSSAFKTALGLHPSPVNFKFKSAGGQIDGHDHDSVGTLLPTSPDSVPPVTVMKSSDSVVVRTEVGANIDELKGTPKIKVDPTITDADTFASNYKTIADTVFTNSGNSNFTINSNLGSASKPVIVYCEGFSGKKFTFQNADGWGILVVKGNLKITGGATWHGLVIVFGDGVVQFDASVGNSTVIGGVLLGGYANSEYDLGGGANILFSMSALRMASTIKKPPIYQIVDWYE